MHLGLAANSRLTFFSVLEERKTGRKKENWEKEKKKCTLVD